MAQTKSVHGRHKQEAFKGQKRAKSHLGKTAAGTASVHGRTRQTTKLRGSRKTAAQSIAGLIVAF